MRRPFSAFFAILAAALGQSLCQAGDSFVAIDEFSEVPGAWSVWQPGERSFSIKKDDSERVQGSPSMQADMKTGYGLLQRGVKIAPSAEGLQFWIKGSNGTKSGSLFLSLSEKDGETFTAEVPFDASWAKKQVLFKDMKLWHYGGSPIENGKLDLEKAVTLKLGVADKQGFVFNIAKLELFSSQAKLEAPKPASKPGSFSEVVVKELEMEEGVPPRASFESLPKTCSDVSISGSSFMRDGRPCFLIGAWEWQNWLLRLLSVDIGYFGADNIYTQYEPKIEDGKLVIARTPAPWYEAQVFRAESNGLLLWHEHKGGTNGPLKKYIPESIDVGHFYAYDPFDPIGRKLFDDMFRSWSRYTRKYPVFCYEALNEVGYSNKHQPSVAEFQRRMKAKYGEISSANAVWGTSFESFEKASPPGLIKVEDPKAIDAGAGVELEKRQAKAHPNLWADWLKFQEDQFGESLDFVLPSMRSSDPRPGVLNTVQSHCSLGWDYGSSGVHPSKIAMSKVDFYSHEDGLCVYPQSARNDVGQIKKMASLAMVCDVVSNLCQDKPVFNAESPLYVSRQALTEEDMAKGDLAGLCPSSWSFFDASSGKEPEGWTELSFDASSWPSVKVPEMWGKQGFQNCTVGLYRKKFSLPPGSPSTLYLNGKGFADAADVYVNGRLVYKTKTWDEAFCVKVEGLSEGANSVCAKIRNSYFKEGMYYGGIRGYVCLNSSPSVSEAVLKPSHVRSHLWIQAVHGMSGDFICYDNTNFQDAIKILPSAKAEIDTVSEIVLPRPRVKAQVAIVYPFETFRVFYPDSYEEYLRAPLCKTLLDHYCALLFSGVGVDVIANSDIVEGRAGNYKMIVAAENTRVPAACVEKLKEFVANGGVLVSEMDSLTVDDDSHAPIDVSSLLGVAPGPCSTREGVLVDGPLFGISKAAPEARRLDKASVCATAPKDGVELCAEFSGSGKPAITRFALGKGYAYHSASVLPYSALRSFYGSLEGIHGVKPWTSVTDSEGKAADFVEAHVFSRDGRNVLYALNWGRKGLFKIQWPGAPEGSYLVRHPLSGSTLKAPDGGERWKASQLRDGVQANLDNMDPLALLVEPSGLKPLAIKGISPERRAMLSKLWNSPQGLSAGKGEKIPTIAVVPEFDGLTNSDLPNTASPCAEELLRLSGFNLVEYSEAKPLDGVDLVFWPRPRQAVSDARIKELKSYVENGGSLLLCGDGMVNWHTGLKNGTSKLWEAFGIRQGYMKWLSIPKPLPGFDFMQVPCPVDSSSPALYGVKLFFGAFTGPIEYGKGKGYETLLCAPGGSSLAGSPLIVEGKIGKGRVLAVGDSVWLTPFNFELGDNPQLLLSLARSLAGLPPEALSEDLKAKAVFISKPALESAEAQEARGVYSFEPVLIKEKGVKTGGKKSSSGYLDPIVDMQN